MKQQVYIPIIEVMRGSRNSIIHDSSFSMLGIYGCSKLESTFEAAEKKFPVLRLISERCWQKEIKIINCCFRVRSNHNFKNIG
jgi:hypothetical protein